MKRQKIFSLLAALAVFFALLFALPFSPKENAGLALLAFVGALWLSEALNLTLTALLIPLLAVALGILPVKQALSAFAQPIIFFFFGSCVLATALHLQGIDRAVANRLLRLTKGHLGYTSIMLFCIAAFLSMWFNNAATAAMLLPLALGMVSELDPQKEQGTCTFVLLGLAFSASIGGLGTMIGTPPNMIAAQSLEMGFAEWLKFGLPVALVMFPLMIVVLYFTFRPNFHHESQVSLHDDFAWTGQRVATVAIFAVAVLAWIFGNTLSEWAAGLPLLSGIAEKNRNGVMAIKDWNAFVALAATVAVCTSGVATWRQVQEKMEWGVILLFGGGLTLSVVLQGSGAGRLLAGIVAHWLDGSPEWVVVFGVATFIIVLTEFTSNLAAAALLIPLFAAVSHKLGMPPQLLTLVIGIGASMAFMLPVATLTNAIVFASGRIRQRDMVKAGFYLSLVAIVVLTLFACLLWRSPMFAG